MATPLSPVPGRPDIVDRWSIRSYASGIQRAWLNPRQRATGRLRLFHDQSGRFSRALLWTGLVRIVAPRKAHAIVVRESRWKDLIAAMRLPPPGGPRHVSAAPRIGRFAPHDQVVSAAAPD